jgi:hypothetical protein
MRTAAWLLTIGLILGFAAALNPKLFPVWTAQLPEKLELIATRQSAWITTSSLFAAGLVAAVLGVAALTGELIRTEEALPSAWVALAAFLVGTTLWLIDLGFRLTVLLSASRDVAAGRPLPAWVEPLSLWGFYLLAGYVILASIGLIFLGQAVLTTQLMPGWTGWVVIGLGALFILGLVISRDTYPVMPHLGTGLIGVVALVQSFSSSV